MPPEAKSIEAKGGACKPNSNRKVKRTRKVKEGKDNEGGKRDKRLKGGQVQFQGGSQEQGSQIVRRFTSKQATEAKARLPQVY